MSKMGRAQRPDARTYQDGPGVALPCRGSRQGAQGKGDEEGKDEEDEDGLLLRHRSKRPPAIECVGVGCGVHTKAVWLPSGSWRPVVDAPRVEGDAHEGKRWRKAHKTRVWGGSTTMIHWPPQAECWPMLRGKPPPPPTQIKAAPQRPAPRTRATWMDACLLVGCWFVLFHGFCGPCVAVAVDGAGRAPSTEPDRTREGRLIFLRRGQNFCAFPPY